MTYRYLGYKKKSASECATARKWRNSIWTFAYRAHRRNQTLWLAIFLLLFALFGMALIMIPMIGKFGRP